VLTRYNLRTFARSKHPHRQISVRIETNTRAALKRAAREKDASVGDIIRAALEA
jgi:hypothetical protein